MCVGACALLSCSGMAMGLREFRALEKTNPQGVTYATYYLVGVAEGVLEAQASAVRQGSKPFICLNGRRFEPRMAREIFETELKRNADVYEADMPLQLVVEQALGTVYPC